MKFVVALESRGASIDTGKASTKDGASGDDTRVQFSAKFDFWRYCP